MSEYNGDWCYYCKTFYSEDQGKRAQFTDETMKFICLGCLEYPNE